MASQLAGVLGSVPVAIKAPGDPNEKPPDEKKDNEPKETDSSYYRNLLGPFNFSGAGDILIAFLAAMSIGVFYEYSDRYGPALLLVIVLGMIFVGRRKGAI